MFRKIRLKAQRNVPMPEGWMIDGQGQPLTDPKGARERFFRPRRWPRRVWNGANVRFAGQNIEWSCVWQRRGRLDRGLENPQQHGADLPNGSYGENLPNFCPGQGPGELIRSTV